jgi:hypothetical protein
MSVIWTRQGEEPTFETFFADPIVDLLLQRDGITRRDVWEAIENARPSAVALKARCNISRRIDRTSLTKDFRRNR